LHANIKKKTMNFLKLIARSLTLYALCSVAAQGQSTSSPRAAADRPAPVSSTLVGQALTAAEVAKVKSVLAPYKPASLTTEDAKMIKRTLRDAGFPKSRELDAALVSSGFSPEKLDQLDPPPPRPAGESARPARDSTSAPQAKK
jgi:hypothetical protein